MAWGFALETMTEQPTGAPAVVAGAADGMPSPVSGKYHLDADSEFAKMQVRDSLDRCGELCGTVDRPSGTRRAALWLVFCGAVCSRLQPPLASRC